MLQVAEDGSMSEREDNAQKKAAEASDLAKEAEADLAEAVSENWWKNVWKFQTALS